MEVQTILKKGIWLKTSGTTGDPKEIFQSPEKLKAANKVAVDSQQLTKNSKVYTVCKIEHAGGLLAQTLPALSIGAEVVIENFNPYRWIKEVQSYTHTHLTPLHCRAIMKTKNFWKSNLKGIWITCGSDPVEWDIIETFVNKGATFMTNWGMTEVGPCAINTVFSNIEQVQAAKLRRLSGTLLGNTKYIDYKIENNQLKIKGEICVYKDWFKTGDLVEENLSGDLYYLGRV